MIIGAMLWVLIIAAVVALSSCSPHPPQIDARWYSIRVNPWCIVRCTVNDIGDMEVGDSENAQDD